MLRGRHPTNLRWAPWGSGYVPPPPPPPPPAGNTLTATPGNAASVIAGAAAGDTVVLQGGAHPALVLPVSFAAPFLTVKCDPGSYIQGTTRSVDTNGKSGYIFDTVDVRLPMEQTDQSKRAFEIGGPSQSITLKNSKVSGGMYTVDIFGNAGSWAGNITIKDNEIWGSGGDLIHSNGCDGLLIEHNWLHDPVHDFNIPSPEHHDCWQAQNTKNGQFVRNICTWLQGTQSTGKYVGDGTFIGQGVIISGVSGACSDILIANNLVHHYTGRPVIVNGVTRCQIVNNTFYRCGDGISISFGDSLSAVEVWNNIMECGYVDSASPSFYDYNWLKGRISDGYLGNITQAHPMQSGATRDPGFISDPAVGDSAYELTAGSPCRGLGIQRTLTPTVDLDDNPRSGLVLGCRI